MKSVSACSDIFLVYKMNITLATVTGRSDDMLVSVPRAIRVGVRDYNKKTKRHLKWIYFCCASEQLKQNNTHRGFKLEQWGGKGNEGMLRTKQKNSKQTKKPRK